MAQDFFCSKGSFLAAHPLLRTTNLDEARFQVSQKFCDHRLELTGETDLNVLHNHAAGQAVSINFLSYGADVHIDPGMLGTFYLLQMPLRGTARIQHRGEDIAANATTATILNPDRDTQMDWMAGCEKLLVQIDQAHLTRVAENFVGGVLPGPIRFDPKIDLTTPNGCTLRRAVLACAKAVDENLLFSGARTPRDSQLEEDIARAVLMNARSNISHMVHATDGRVHSAALRRAVDYIHANMSEPISLADISRQSGLNVRSLQQAFRKNFGLSPMRMLRNVRLDAARYHLDVRANAPTVMEVAYASGFSHLGRFSRDYKDRFGHLPSRPLG